MRKILFILPIMLAAIISLSAFSNEPTKPMCNNDTINGQFITDTVNGCDRYSFTFVKDSMYYDMYTSGCGVSIYRLVKQESNDSNILLFKAYETYFDGCDEIHDTVMIKLTKMNSYRYTIRINGSKPYYINKVLK